MLNLLKSFFVLFILVGIIQAEETKPCYEILYDKTEHIKDETYIYKVIEKSDFSGATDFFVGKLIVRGAESDDINCFLLTPDQFEKFQGGEVPENATILKKRIKSLTIEEPLSWKKVAKYYLVIDNGFSVFRDKDVYLYLIRIFKR